MHLIPKGQTGDHLQSAWTGFWLMMLVSPSRRCLRPSLANYPDLQLLEECKDETGEELLPAVSGNSRSTGDFSAKEIFDVIHMVAKMI